MFEPTCWIVAEGPITNDTLFADDAFEFLDEGVIWKRWRAFDAGPRRHFWLDLVLVDDRWSVFAIIW